MMRSVRATISRFSRRAPFTLVAGICLIFALAGWRQSGRFSERHLVDMGYWTIEVFSASSLLRVSLVQGHIANFGAKTSYRHPNPRGAIRFQPTLPKFRIQPRLWEITLGHWHLAAVMFATFLTAGTLEIRRWFGLDAV